MATRLEDFREKYPQYNDWTDEELAEGLRVQYYDDWDIAEYRDQMGLDPLPDPPKPPTIRERVNDFLFSNAGKADPLTTTAPKPKKFYDPGGVEIDTQEEPDADPAVRSDSINGARSQVKASEPSYDTLAGLTREQYGTIEDWLNPGDPQDHVRSVATWLQENPEREGPPWWDQWFAGYDEYLANYSIHRSLRLGKEIGAVARDDKTTAGKYGKGDYAARTYRQTIIDRDPTAYLVKLTDELQVILDDRVERRFRAQATRRSPATERFLAGASGEGFGEFWDHPITLIAEIGIRSLPNMLETIPLALAAGSALGPWGFAAGIGAGSFMVEYRARLTELIEKEGFDLNKAADVIAIANNPELLSSLSRQAGFESGLVAAPDALTGGIATRMLVPPQVKGVVAAELINLGNQMIVQMIGGGTGEALAQTARGEGYHLGEIGAEVLGELVTGPMDVGLAVLSGVRQQRTEADIASAIADIYEKMGIDPEIDPDIKLLTWDGDVPTPETPFPETDVDETGQPILRPDEAVGETWNIVVGGQNYPVAINKEIVTDQGNAYDVDITMPGGQVVGATLKAGENIMDLIAEIQEHYTDEELAGEVIEPEIPDEQTRIDEMTGEELIAEIRSTRQEVIDVFADSASTQDDRNVALISFQNLMRRAETDIKNLPAEMQEQARQALQTIGALPDVPEIKGTSAYIDPRMKRRDYRGRLAAMSGELSVGGGGMGALIREEAYAGEFDQTGERTGEVISRAPSENPTWFQEMVAVDHHKMSVRQLEKAVVKAIQGDSLGVRQQRVIVYMLNVIGEERNDMVDGAKEQLLAAREIRRQARARANLPPATDETQSGEIFQEDEYGDDMTATSRIIYELMEEASAAGIAEDVLEGFAIQHQDKSDQQYIQALERLIHEYRNQAGAETVAPQPPAITQPGPTHIITADEYEAGVAGDRADGVSGPLGLNQANARIVEGMRIYERGRMGLDNYSMIRLRALAVTLGAPKARGMIDLADNIQKEAKRMWELVQRFGIHGERAGRPSPAAPETEGAPAPAQGPLPWKMSRRGEGDLYIQRVGGKNAGTVFRERQGPNDFAISFEPGVLLPDFMFYLLQHLQPQIAARARGGLQQAIRMEDVSEVLIAHFRRQGGETEAARDLFGDVSKEQALADEIRRRDEKRNTGQESIETGDLGDLFSQARQQMDLVDVVDEQAQIARERLQELLDGAIRRFAMESQGQDILDYMSENEISPHVVTEVFWTETYFQINAESQAKFHRMLKGLGFEPGYIGSVEKDGTENVLETWVDVGEFVGEDLPDDAEYLEGTERGYVALMYWANDARPTVEDEEIPTMVLEEPPDDIEFDAEIEPEPTAEQLAEEEERPLTPEEQAYEDRQDAAQPEEDLTDTGYFRQFGERRIDTERRINYDAMPTSELIELLYTDVLTGISNERAFQEEGEDHAWLAAIDIDSLKFINDKMGHDAGDAMIIAVANALDQVSVDAYRIHGDEFFLGADNRNDLVAALALAKGILSTAKITAGSSTKIGVQFTYGIAQDKQMADAEMQRQKELREKTGERLDRDSPLPPEGFEASIRPEPPVNMEPGSNYQGGIGKHGDLPVDANHNYRLGDGRIVRIPKKPLRRQDIIAALQRHFGRKIFQGRVHGKTRLGFYRAGIGEIRIKDANDIETTAHEFSHWFDDRYLWISKLYRQHKAEVKSVSYDVKKIWEGWAVFMEHWFTQDYKAYQGAPAFYDAFMADLENHPAERDALFEIQELMHAWHLQGARARALSKQGPRDMTLHQRYRETVDGLPDYILQKTVDRLRPFKQAERDILGGVLSPNFGGYSSLRLASGAHGMVLAAIDEHGGTLAWDENGDIKFVGRGLDAILKPGKGHMVELEQYFIGRRAQELAKQGRENHFRTDEIVAMLSYGDQFPEFDKIHEEYLAWSSEMLQFYRDSGLISEATFVAFEEMNKNYVPFNRIAEMVMDKAGRKRARARGASPFMRLRGGTENIANVFETILGNLAYLVHLSLVNVGKRNFYRMISNQAGSIRKRRYGGNTMAGNWAVPIPKDKKPVHIHKDMVIRQVLDGLGLSMSWYNMASQGMINERDGTFEEQIAVLDMIDRMKDGMAEMVLFFQTGVDPQGNVDFYFEEGEKVFYEIIDPGLYEAIGQLGPQSYNMAVNIMGGFANLLRTGVVMTPTFQFKNMIRDTLNAFTLSKGQMIPLVDAMKALMERIYNDEHYWLYMANGGGFASIAEAEGIDADRIIDNPRKMMAAYNRGISTFEYANRIAEFKVMIRKGFTKREAALAGREISTDFSMHGSSRSLRMLTISVPFLNARMEGFYRNMRELAEMPPGERLKWGGRRAWTYAVKAMMTITLPSLYLYAQNKDDERYKEIPDWIKDLNWIIFTGPGEDDYVMIPKPFETGMVWGTIPERAIEYYYLRDEKELGDALLWMALQTFALDLTPQIFQPWVELSRNRKFTGAPIIPEYMKGMLPQEQWRYYTSDAMIALGRKLGISPMKAEHIVKGIFGTLGAWGLGVADMMVGDLAAGGERPSWDPWRENILVSPFVNKGPLKRTDSEDDLYELLAESREITMAMSQMSRRNPAFLGEFIKDDAERQAYLGINQSLNQYATEMSALRRSQDMIASLENMSGDEKREKIEAIQRAMNEMSTKVRAAINPIMVRDLIEEIETDLSIEKARRAVGGAQ